MAHNHRTGRRRSLQLTLVLIASLAFLTPSLSAPVMAQGVRLGGVDIHEQSVAVEFPEAITFRLRADAGRTVERVELRYQPVESDVTRAVRPAFTPARSIDITYSLDTLIRYMPPGIDITYRWILALDDGSLVETEPETFFFIDNRYDWQQVSDGLVTVYFYESDRAFGEQALDVTVRTIDTFAADFDAPLQDPIRLVIYNSVSEFQSALPFNSPEWIGGFADPSMNLIVAGVSPGAGASREMGRMLSHEAIHLAVAQTTDNPFNSPPPWLDEGLAVTYQEVADTRFDRVLALARDDGRLIPIRALNSGFPNDPDLAILSYAQSESVVAFLIDTRGHAGVAALLEAYRGGVSHEEAVVTGLGITLNELDAEWKAWLGYEGDQSATGFVAREPGAGERIEGILSIVGVMPLLALGSLLVVIVGISGIIRAFRTPIEEPDEGPVPGFAGEPWQTEFDSDDDDDFERDFGSKPWGAPQP